MSQYDFTPLDADTDDGTQLVTDLNSWVGAVVTQHAGTTRPAYLKQGSLWVDNSGSPELILKLFDGAVDRELARVTSGGTVLSGEQASIWAEIIPGHDLAPGIAVYNNGTSWLRARADVEATTAKAIVRAVSGTRVTFQQNGLLEVLTALTPGATYWLSATTAGQLVTTKPATGYAQVIMSAMSSTRALVAVGPVQAVDGVVRLRPAINGNVIQGLDANVVPIQLRRRADQLADLLTVESESGTIIGSFDKNGVPWGTLAPTAFAPAGAIMFYFGNTAPAGWVLCDGAAIPVQYTVLRSLFGTNMPDWRGRFPIASHPTSFPTGGGGGAYSVALGAANMPAGLQIVTNVGINTTSARPNIALEASADGSAYALNVTAFRGTSAPISTMPPYIGLTLICRAG
jgi:microcystin-dependent protein